MQKPPLPNEKLEAIFKQSGGRIKEKHVSAGVAATGWAKNRVDRWFAKRRLVNQPSRMQKFCEESWRCLFYLTTTVYGLYVLWDKSWFADPLYCWVCVPEA